MRPPGHCTAAPGTTPGQRNLTRHCRGTSNSSALATRQAAEFIELLGTLRNEPGGQIINTVPESLWLKVLLVHGARWPVETADLVSRITGVPASEKASLTLLRRLTGYGLPDFQRVATCTDTRVTVLSGGALKADEGHTHHVPLPASMSGRTSKRSLTVTLAYFTPIDPKRREYSIADLWFKIVNRNALQLGGAGADHYVVQRGTVQHTTFVGEGATVIQERDTLDILVSCREQIGPLTDPVPYALAVTLDVAPALDIRIYEEVREQIRQRLRIRPTN